jgi:hypothetical protein
VPYFAKPKSQAEAATRGLLVALDAVRAVTAPTRTRRP